VVFSIMHRHDASGIQESAASATVKPQGESHGGR
jgi:hypothetical protein